MTKFSNFVSHTIAALTLGALVCGAGATASAQSAAPAGRETVSVQFVYDPAASLEQNYKHIRSTARRTCGWAISRPIALRASARKCADRFVDMAVAGFAVQELAELHLAKTGRWAAEAVQTAAKGR